MQYKSPVDWYTTSLEDGSKHNPWNKQIDRNFDVIFQAATHFAELVNSELDRRNVNVEIALKKKRIWSNQPIEAKDKYRATVHNMVMIKL